MPFGPSIISVRRHTVLFLDRGVRILLPSVLTIMAASPAQAGIRCDQLFSEDRAPYYDIALDAAQTKSVREFDSYDGLSIDDLQMIVEKVYKQQEGETFKIPDYFKMNAEQRTRAFLIRKLGEKITHAGLINYFRSQGILLDESTLITKIKILNRAKITNIASATMGVTSVLRGRAPILMPNLELVVKNDDMITLVLRGIDSKEGREIVKKYKLTQETTRAYTILSEYYERIAITVVAIVIWEKGEDFFKQKHDHLLVDLWETILKELKAYEG